MSTTPQPLEEEEGTVDQDPDQAPSATPVGLGVAPRYPTLPPLTLPPFPLFYSSLVRGRCINTGPTFFAWLIYTIITTSALIPLQHFLL